MRSGRPRAIVLGVEHPRGVAVVRSLGRQGVGVVAVEHDPLARGLRSRYLELRVLVDVTPAAALAALEALGAEDGGVLIPTNDHYLAIVSQHFERLSRWFSITVPPWNVLQPLMDKPQCYDLGRAAGLRTPRCFAPRDAAELDRIVAGLDLETQRYILSVRLPGTVPIDAITGRMTMVADGGTEAIRARSLAVAARTGDLPILVEVVPGRSDRCVGVSLVVDRNHTPVIAYCVRRLQLQLYASDTRSIHPYEMGANVYCESVRDEEAVAAATRLVRQANFYGAITVEFRRDARDGQLTLIKADPRVVRATALSATLGLDVPTALYDVFSGRRREVALSYPEGRAWLWPTRYFDTVWANRRRAPLGPPVRAILGNVHRIRSFAYLSVRDPGPALADLSHLVRRTTRLGGRAIRSLLRLEFIRGLASRARPRAGRSAA
jgi:predicted ATP-grasp superfamily ATP-dependent carboligase